MERRDFLKIFSLGTVAAMSGQLTHRSAVAPEYMPFDDMDTTVREFANSIELMTSRVPNSIEYLNAFQPHRFNEAILATSSSPDRQSYLSKMASFENSHRVDVYLGRDRYPVLISSFKRIDRVQNLVGHGNFNVVSFDEMLKCGKRYSSVGEFTIQEKEFLEELFVANARQYGFLGDKVMTELTAPISKRDRKKVDRTGHFLYRGESEALYKKLKADLGNNIVLTSGIRSVVKQTHLFLAKTIASKGNLSKASRSLAPPGHSYHGVGYVDIRYHRENMLGVRYEPWHIKVV